MDAKMCIVVIKKTNACAHISATLRVEVTAVECTSHVSQPDRTYDLKIGQPTVSYFLKQAAGIAKGARKTGEACCDRFLIPASGLTF